MLVHQRVLLTTPVSSAGGRGTRIASQGHSHIKGDLAQLGFGDQVAFRGPGVERKWSVNHHQQQQQQLQLLQLQQQQQQQLLQLTQHPSQNSNH